MKAPLEALKLSVERLLKEYKPPEHVVESLELTWKGGLWRMALEAALGVQYLHHHRYERSPKPVPNFPVRPALTFLLGTGVMGARGSMG
jgi:hypothetical protein